MVAANISLAFGTKVSVKQVMAEYGICRGTFENWCANGLAAARMGRLIFTTREALADFEEPYAVGGTNDTPTARGTAASYAEAERLLSQ